MRARSAQRLVDRVKMGYHFTWIRSDTFGYDAHPIIKSKNGRIIMLGEKGAVKEILAPKTYKELLKDNDRLRRKLSEERALNESYEKILPLRQALGEGLIGYVTSSKNDRPTKGNRKKKLDESDEKVTEPPPP